MTREEIIAQIAQLDPEVKVDAAPRVKELRLILDGLEAPARIKNLEDDLGQLSEQLTEAEAKPAAKGGKFAEKAGTHKGKEVTMLVPKANVDGDIVTPADFRKKPELLEKALKLGAGYLRIEA